MSILTKVIFLDFDGVINNGPHIKRVGSLQIFDPESISQLCRVLKETGAKIVVSSTWRFLSSKDELNERLFLSGLPKESVIDVTPLGLSEGKSDNTIIELHMTRGQEINLWLSKNDHIKDWVAVDDDKEMSPLDLSRVVKTDYQVGLQAVHADQMIRILGKLNI